MSSFDRSEMIRLSEEARLRNLSRSSLQNISSNTPIPLPPSTTTATTATTATTTVVAAPAVTSIVPLARNKVAPSPLDLFKEWREKKWKQMENYLQSLFTLFSKRIGSFVQRNKFLVFVISTSTVCLIVYYYYVKPKLVEPNKIVECVQEDQRVLSNVDKNDFMHYARLANLLETRLNHIGNKLRVNEERLQSIIRERNRLAQDKKTLFSPIEVLNLLVFDELEFLLIENEALKIKVEALEKDYAYPKLDSPSTISDKESF